MAAVAERGVLVAILKNTKEEPSAKGNIRASVRVTGELFDKLLGNLEAEGLITLRGDLLEVSVAQRLSIAVRAVLLGTDIERVCRALGWLEFEEMTAHVFEVNGYRVLRRHRFAAEGRRWEIDVLALRRPLIVCAECKRWSRGLGNATVKKIVELHLEKVRIFGDKIREKPGKIGLRWRGRATIVPMVMSLQPAPLRLHCGVPIVPILELPSFLGEFEGHLGHIAHFTVELPSSKPQPTQTTLRKG